MPKQKYIRITKYKNDFNSDSMQEREELKQ